MVWSIPTMIGAQWCESSFGKDASSRPRQGKEQEFQFRSGFGSTTNSERKC